MNPKSFALFLIVLTALFPVGWLASRIVYKPFGVPDLRRGEFEAIQKGIKLRQSLHSQENGRKAPYFELASPSTFDLGALSDGQSWQAEIRVRNVGNILGSIAAFHGNVGGLHVEGSRAAIAPNETQRILVQGVWNSDEESFQLDLRSTDDFGQVPIEVTFRGRTLKDLFTESPGISFGNIPPDEVKFRSIDIFSETGFIQSVKAVPNGCNAVPDVLSTVRLGKDDLDRNAKSGMRIQLALVGDGTRSSEECTVSLEAVLADESGAERLQSTNVSVVTYMQSRLRATGDLSNLGGLDFGSLEAGNASTKMVVLQSRGDRLPSHVAVAKVYPDFLRATIKRTDRADRYDLQITIPSDAPQGAYDSRELGRVEIECDLLSSNLVIPVVFSVFDYGR